MVTAIGKTVRECAAMEEINASIEELSDMAETISQISRGMTD